MISNLFSRLPTDRPVGVRALVLVLSLCSASLPASDRNPEAPLPSISIDHGDGGRDGKRHRDKLLSVLREAGCEAVEAGDPGQGTGLLHFDPAPVSSSTMPGRGYRLIARARSPQGETAIRGAILVHASTGLSRVADLKGQRIAFVGKDSPTGYQAPLKLFQAAGIEEQWDTHFYAGNHVGSVSSLLHSDTDISVVAEPLARRWASNNDLAIVAVSEAVETGGWWASESLSSEVVDRCADALAGLQPTSMKALPAWIGSFARVP